MCNALSELMVVFLAGYATGGSVTSELCCKVGAVIFNNYSPQAQ